MRGVGAICTASRHGRPKRMTAPEYCKVDAARTQRRRLSGCSGCRRPVPRESDGVGLWLRPKASTHTRQACAGGPNRRWATAVAHRDRQAPIQSNPHRTGERNVLSAGADSEASSEAAARRERMAAIIGHRDARPSCLHAMSAISAPHTDHGSASSGVRPALGCTGGGTARPQQARLIDRPTCCRCTPRCRSHPRLDSLCAL